MRRLCLWVECARCDGAYHLSPLILNNLFALLFCEMKFSVLYDVLGDFKDVCGVKDFLQVLSAQVLATTRVFKHILNCKHLG